MIPETWKKNGGFGINVGVCDTGLNKNLPCFVNKNITYKQFGDVSLRHGTHIASTIYQIAPKVNMFFAGGILDNFSRMEKMLKWLSTFDLDILNLSLAFKIPDDGVMSVLRRINDKGTMIICAYARDAKFPWSEKDFLSAGEEGDFPAPKAFVSYSSSGSLTRMKGTSVSAAITTGLYSLGKSVDKTLTKQSFLSTVKPTDVPEYEQKKRQVNIKL